jgi:hypothetical protein
MKKTIETTLANLSANYVTALRRAETATATAGQQGAWLIACHMASGQSIDEAFETVKAFLREKGEGPNAIEKSRPLVPFAVSIRNTDCDGDPNSFPKGIDWPTLSFAKSVSTVTNRTASSVASFVEDMTEAREMGRQDVTAQFIAKGIDRDPTPAEIDKRVISLASAKRKKSDGTGNGDRLLSFLRNPEELKNKIGSLTEEEIDAIEEVIESIRDARNAVSY